MKYKVGKDMDVYEFIYLFNLIRKFVMISDINLITVQTKMTTIKMIEQKRELKQLWNSHLKPFS